MIATLTAVPPETIGLHSIQGLAPHRGLLRFHCSCGQVGIGRLTEDNAVQALRDHSDGYKHWRLQQLVSLPESGGARWTRGDTTPIDLDALHEEAIDMDCARDAEADLAALSFVELDEPGYIRRMNARLRGGVL